MDRILVLSQGRVIEQGTFDQLLAQRGVFTAMAARQSIFPQAA
jgi:ABC-type multidrug transport system fused ATPase/permease subunit